MALVIIYIAFSSLLFSVYCAGVVYIDTKLSLKDFLIFIVIAVVPLFNLFVAGCVLKDSYKKYKKGVSFYEDHE